MVKKGRRHTAPDAYDRDRPPVADQSQPPHLDAHYLSRFVVQTLGPSILHSSLLPV